ncbi:unnamed protein product [Plutella xylostella]|uniref:(diamondback moth) hypothetical protein n=1 Tax=Plutella xylostella TaxID=51655 RepID=A0A8S4EVK5_PLUXY|nr:unnamed protein product [Plutella xylostella]
MIINKSAHQRGFAAGSIYKSEVLDLENPSSYFCRDPAATDLHQFLDEDGLPPVGAVLKFDDPFYSYYDADKSSFVLHKFKYKEAAAVDSVRQCGDFNVRAGKKAIIMMRIQV